MKKQPRLAGSFRELGDGVGRAHSVVQRWVKHPAWDQSRTPPWDIARAQAWAARTLQPNPARAWDEPRETPGAAGADGIEALRKSPLAAAKLKLTVVRAQYLELQKAILSGEYVPRRDIEQALVQRVHAVRAAFEALPRQLAGTLAGLAERQIEEQLDEAIRTVLLALSQRPELPALPNTEVHT